MAEKTCYYEVLRIERSAGKTEIDRAYRKLAIKYHPDSNRDDESAVEKFKEPTKFLATAKNEGATTNMDMPALTAFTSTTMLKTSLTPLATCLVVARLETCLAAVDAVEAADVAASDAVLIFAATSR